MTKLSPVGAREDLLRPTVSGTEFLDVVRRAVGFREHLPLADPLASAVEQIRQNAAFSQSRLLLRIIVTLANGTGEFRREELATLDSASAALVLALEKARATGAISPAAWAEAIAAATPTSA